MPSYEMFPLIFMGEEMILFENSVLQMYLLNTHLSFNINSLNYFLLFICFIKQFVGSISTHIGHRLRLGLIPGLIWKRSCINLYLSNVPFGWLYHAIGELCRISIFRGLPQDWMIITILWKARINRDAQQFHQYQAKGICSF